MSANLELRHVRNPFVLVSTTFGVGFLPRMPGTIASAVAVLIWWFTLSEVRGFVQLGIILVCLPVAWICTKAVMTKYNVGDDPAITIDEVIGQWIALIAVPKSFWFVAAAFIGFRILDILKPDPVGWAERKFKGAVGVLADDVVAGIVAVAILHYIAMFLA